MLAPDEKLEGGADAPSSSEVRKLLPIVCNTPDDVLFRNVRSAVAAGWPILPIAAPHDQIAAVVGGGPSAEDDLAYISEHFRLGHAIFALNGAALWLQSFGIIPHAVVLMDARPHNARFATGLNPNIAAYIASQCDPSVFDAASAGGNPIIAWHPNFNGESGVEEKRPTLMLGGGSSVGIRSLPLVYALGYRTVHLYGYDSSYRDGDAHAYDQPENAGDRIRECWVNGKPFVSTAWMIRQADDFTELLPHLVNAGMHIGVHGYGLLPTLVRSMVSEAA